jgi:hypothetical protein
MTAILAVAPYWAGTTLVAFILLGLACLIDRNSQDPRQKENHR